MKCLDGFCMNILHEKEYNGCTFYKCTYFPKSEITYIVKNEKCLAHGETLRDAMSDLEYKLSSNEDRAYHINRIAKQGYMNATDYRLLTGACKAGTDHFLKLNNLTWDDTMPVEKILELTKNQFGFFAFEGAAKEILSLMKH